MNIGEVELNRSIIVTGSAPLFALAVMQALDALLEPGLPVIVPDMVRLEVLARSRRPVLPTLLIGFVPMSLPACASRVRKCTKTSSTCLRQNRMLK